MALRCPAIDAARTYLALACEEAAQLVGADADADDAAADADDADDADDAGDADAAALNAWFAERGGVGSVEVRTTAPGRRGLVATGRVAAGDAYVTMPRGLPLDRATALASVPFAARIFLR